MNGGQRNGTNAQIWGKQNTLIMVATVPHVTSGLGLRKFQADGFLLTRVYFQWLCTVWMHQDFVLFLAWWWLVVAETRCQDFKIF